MRYPTPYAIPERPPAEVLAELDAAARTLHELAGRSAQLTLGMDDDTRSLRVELRDDGGARRLSATQLLDFLVAS